MVLKYVSLHYYFPVEDLERNNGKDKPYFMNQNLMTLLNVKNKTGQSGGGEPQVEMSKRAK